MKNNLIKIQALVLLIGTGFSWYTVYKDFARFYEIYGSITRIKDCTIPNPVTTPCFYGAFAFLLAFIWASKILIDSQKIEINIDLKQKRLHWLLIASTIFAWSNFAYGTFRFYTTTALERISCSGIPTNSVFTTPCFYGSVIFLMALIVSILIKKSLTPKMQPAEENQ